MDILKNLWYMARRFKTATTLNLLGLAVAFAALYLLLTQVSFNQGYNRNFPNAERLFRFEAKMGSEAPWGINCNRPTLESISQMPEVEGIAINWWSGRIELYKGETSMTFPWEQFSYTTIETLGARCLDGQLTYTEGDDLKSFILPASVAEQLCGTTMAAGRMVWNGQDSIPVRGVYEDFPANCYLGYNPVIQCMGQQHINDYSEWSFRCCVRLHEGVDAEAFREEFAERLYRIRYEQIWGRILDAGQVTEADREEYDRQFREEFAGDDMRLTPLTETYFSGVSDTDRGNPAVMWVLQVAALLVVIVAAINLLNFTLAQAPMRVRGVNTRRVLGESLMRLRLSLVGEALLSGIISLALATGMIYLITLWPTTSELLQGSLAFTGHPVICAICFGVGLSVCAMAALYPAWFVTSFQPALALKGSFALTPKGRRLRTGLICLQLTVSYIMVIYLGVLLLQSRFIYRSDYGFAKDELLYANLPAELKARKDAIRAELMKESGVVDVAFSQSPLGLQDGYMGWGRSDNDHSVTFTALPVDWRYLRTMGIKVIEGRDFAEYDGDVYIINEAARKQWDWVEMDKPLLNGELTVVGVCEDIRYASVRKDRHTEPVAFVILGERYAEWGDRLGLANIRVAADVDKRDALQRVQKRLTELNGGTEVEVKFLDMSLDNLYRDEQRFIRQVLAFGIICLAITLVGVFCLTMFETEYRRKEIGIRKVFGSSARGILALLSRRYVVLTLIAFAIAVPLGSFVGAEWLQGFAERTPIHWWLFPLSLLFVAAVTLLTVTIQGWRAATENPINCIKTE